MSGNTNKQQILQEILEEGRESARQVLGFARADQKQPDELPVETVSSEPAEVPQQFVDFVDCIKEYHPLYLSAKTSLDRIDELNAALNDRQADIDSRGNQNLRTNIRMEIKAIEDIPAVHEAELLAKKIEEDLIAILPTLIVSRAERGRVIEEIKLIEDDALREKLLTYVLHAQLEKRGFKRGEAAAVRGVEVSRPPLVARDDKKAQADKSIDAFAAANTVNAPDLITENTVASAQTIVDGKNEITIDQPVAPVPASTTSAFDSQTFIHEAMGDGDSSVLEAPVEAAIDQASDSTTGKTLALGPEGGSEVVKASEQTQSGNTAINSVKPAAADPASQSDPKDLAEVQATIDDVGQESEQPFDYTHGVSDLNKLVNQAINGANNLTPANFYSKAADVAIGRADSEDGTDGDIEQEPVEQLKQAA